MNRKYERAVELRLNEFMNSVWVTAPIAARDRLSKARASKKKLLQLIALIRLSLSSHSL
jgi:hypothetical protein